MAASLPLVSRRWLVVACVAYAAVLAVIVLVASVGGTYTMFGWLRSVPLGDKLGHFVLIGGLALSVDLAWPRDLRLGRLALPLAAAAIGGLALAEELSQIALPTRTFDPLDLLADFLGIATFVGLGRVARSGQEREVPAARG